ncbi:RNA polymerase sigma factor SigJ [Streptacidiphilus melanogenes]|uniref:RNA polymerase sigma factor SigJ n=1 Tax=Streptacidiphilus melanogenes TaxID=411235 RepID=UPI0005A7DDC5|nr:RNA polymerase sigma factor SigJ [Streptacidiphilus melanogenes]
MTDPTDPTGPADATDPVLDAVVRERRHLLNLAYRLLGSLAEAEDAVQETYARWYAMSREQQEAIESPGAWLTRVASRVCLDVLGSARARRERYVGEWIPEPVPGGTEWLAGVAAPRAAGPGAGGDAADPAERVTLDESVSMAFLVVLEEMTPAQRVALILHDVFAYSFTEVAAVTGRTPAACRELASAARRRLRQARPASAEAGFYPAAQAALVRDFKQAWQAHDVKALVALLDPAAVFTADGGGLAPAALHPIHGAAEIARFVVEVSQHQRRTATLVERLVNGRPGLLVRIGGETAAVYAFDVAEDRITRIWAVRNPLKLRAWAQG